MATSTGTASTAAPTFRNTSPPCIDFPLAAAHRNHAARGSAGEPGRRGYALPGCAEGNTVVRHEATVAPAGQGRRARSRSAATLGAPLPGAARSRQRPGRSVAPERLDREAARLQRRQHAEHRRARLAGHGDQLVHRPVPDDQRPGHGPFRRGENGDHVAARRGPTADRRAGRTRPGRSWRHLVQQAEVLDELGDARHDPRLWPRLAQEREAAGDRGVVEPPGHDVQPPPLLERPRRRRQGAAARTGLDHDRRVREAADDPVAPRERAARRRRLGRELADHRAAALDDRPRQPAMRRPDRGARGPRR